MSGLAARFGLQAERPGQLAQARVARPLRERGHQLEQPVPRVALGQDLEQPLPGRRPDGAVQAAGQVTAQLDGLPVLRGGRVGQPRPRGPGRLPLRLIVGFGFRLGPFLDVIPRLGFVLALDRVITDRAVRTAALFAHWRASLLRSPCSASGPGASPRAARWWPFPLSATVLRNRPGQPGDSRYMPTALGSGGNASLNVDPCGPVCTATVPLLACATPPTIASPSPAPGMPRAAGAR